MSKIRYILCGILVVLCTCGVMFSGCGNSIDNLAIKLTSSALVESEDSSEYSLTLTKSDTDEDESWSVTVSAEVLNLGDNMSSKIEWDYDNRYIELQSSADGSTATIKGVTKTSIPTKVTAYSVENRNAQAVINVTNIVKPKSISGSKFGAGELGIPKNTAFSIKPDEIFTFLPEDATVPVYEYTIEGVTVSSDEEFKLSGINKDYVTLNAVPKDRAGLTDEQIASLSYSLEKVRLYTPLTDENTKLLISGSSTEASEITLIKNSSSGENQVVLKVSAPSGITYTATSPDNVVFSAESNPRGALRVMYDNTTQQFTLLGFEAMEDYKQVDINFSVYGIKNSLVLTKSLRVRIIDYPTAIAVNGVAGDSDVPLRVFNEYAPGELGTELRLNIAPSSKIFTKITLEVDTFATSDLSLVKNLLVNKKAFEGSMKVTSGTTLYLTNNGGYGQIVLNAYAEDTRGKTDEVSRKIIINLEQSVSAISIPEQNIDKRTDGIVLELDEYNDNATNSYRTIVVGVEPENASFDTVSVLSSDTNIFDVEIKNNITGEILITANNIGTAYLSLVAQSGVSKSYKVTVVALLKAMAIKLDPNMSPSMYASNMTQTKTFNINNGAGSFESLAEAWIAKTGSGNSVYLMNEFYPNSAIESNMVLSVEFTSKNEEVASLYNTNSSIYKNSLTTYNVQNRSESVKFDVVVKYLKLEAGQLVETYLTLTDYFTINVFQQIESISINESSVELLASIQSVGGSTTSTSVYDEASTKKALQITVSPSNSYYGATYAKWSINGNTSKIVISDNSGASTVVSSKPLAGNDISVSAKVIVSITDLNGVTFVKEVSVLANKIQQITDVYINNYESSLKNNSLYFELYKKDTFTLDVTVGPQSATNKNLEYIIFDAELSDVYRSGEDYVRMATSDGSYTYYKVLSRTGSSVYDSQYSCKTARLEVNDDGTYEIVPVSAGYAFVYIIPQDIATDKIGDLKQLSPQLRNVTDRSTIKRLPITVADGEKVYYQLYTPEDVASISSTADGLKKNYYVMNTIDMSPYINAQLNANSKWTWTPIGNSSNPFEGSIQSMKYSGESPTQNIVGWTLGRNLQTVATNSKGDYYNYGIFGVVTGKIDNINFYYNSYAIEQGYLGYADFNYGLVVGALKVVKDKDGNITKSGTVSNLNIYCSKLDYKYARLPNSSNTSRSANIGAVGYVEAGASVDGLSVSIASANISSDDMIVNFGGLLGRNDGILGTGDNVDNYTSSSDVNGEMTVTYAKEKSTASTFGGAVGLNTGVIKNVRATGSLKTATPKVVVGGVAGQNIEDANTKQVLSTSAEISNVLSSVKIAVESNSTESIQGGIVGYSSGGSITFAYFDIYLTETDEAGQGIIATGSTGGIAGQIVNTKISYAIVQAYEITQNSQNLVNKGGYLGGIVGYATGGTIEKSFVWAGLRGEAGTTTGLIGEAKMNAPITINNVYVRGYLTTNTNANGYACVSSSGSNVTIKDAYFDLNNDKLTIASGRLNTNNVYMLYTTVPVGYSPFAVVEQINRDDFKSKTISALKFNSDDWSKDSATENPINNGFPYLLNDGKAFIRQIPKTIQVTANTFKNMTEDGRINHVLNFEEDKLIIAYESEKVYNLADLFSLTSDLGVSADKISIAYTLNGTSVIQLLTTADFTKTQIKIIGVGTAYLKIRSSQNSKAYDVIQICVIDAFDSVEIYDGDENILEKQSGGDYYTLKIKHNGSTQVNAEYYQGDGINKTKVTSVMGGVKFITGLKYDANTEKFVTLSDASGEISYNYKISTSVWEQGKWDSEDCLYYYVANNDKLVFTAVGDDKNIMPITLIVPYFVVQFYELDSDKNIASATLKETKHDLLGLNEMSFETQVYYGVSGIAMGVGDNTTISASEKLESSVTITNDAYTEVDYTSGRIGINRLLWYRVYEVYDGGETEEIIYYLPQWNGDVLTKTSSDIYVNFNGITYYESSTAVVVDYSVEMSQTMRKKLKSNKTYRIVIGAIDDNRELLENVNVSLDWTFTPQKVNSVVIEHFSDAIDTGSKITQAGDEPTNTIVAGEYGLLRITLSPDYANFDSVEVTSSTVNGQPLSLDQRVVVVTTNKATGEDVYSYISWQQGVENIENGISLCRASLPNGEFDGKFYVRTICLSTLPTGTQFTVTVKIIANGKEDLTVSRTLTVYKTDVLSIAGEEECKYKTASGQVRYIVATGTGMSTDGSEVLEQNLNPITVNVGSAYYESEISVDGGAKIVRVDGKYYLNTKDVAIGNLITVTLTAKQNIGGFSYRATRSITYEVVDFYIKSLNNDVVMPKTKRFAFIHNHYYNLSLFDGIETIDDLSKTKVITFDPTNKDTCNKVLTLINTINGKTGDYNGWYYRVVGTDGTISFANLIAKDIDDTSWIDNNYRFIKSSSAGYQVVGSGISTGNLLQYNLLFDYNAGTFELAKNSSVSSTFGMSTGTINMEFYQITSQEHPQPVRTLNQFMSMEADIDYILLSDLTIEGSWTPLNVAVRSFNGNGYTIHFNATSIVPSSTDDYNYGLFGTIDSASVIKNVRIELGENGLAINNDEESLNTLNYGVLAGTNKGTIYNCSIYGYNSRTRLANKMSAVAPTNTSASVSIAGLVAINSGGISNSRVEYVNIDAGGNVAGLVVNNSGVISSSYYTGGTITNRSESSNYATAGLVIQNERDAVITSSFSGGTYSVTDTNGTTILDSRASVVKSRDVTIQSGVTSAGFVFTNYGNVSDSYSAVAIFSTQKSGFVFTNYSSGKIARCYSTSDLSSTGSIVTSYAFIGLKSDNATENNNYNKTDGIVNCFYYDTGFANTSLEEAKPLTEEDFCGTNGNNVFTDFLFSRDGEAGSEFTGVWVFSNSENLYFTPDRFVSYLKVASNSEIEKLYTNFGPKLVDASLIATPKMELIKSEENSAGEIVHTYSIKYSSVFKVEQNEDYGTDYSYDPIAVSNMTQFNDAFDLDSESIIKSGNLILSDIRIVNHLTQSDLNSGVALRSPTSQYAGILSGNGFTFNDISLALDDEVEYYGLIGKLTYKSQTSDESVAHIGTIKNYNATVSNISCSSGNYVGGLVGSVENANLYKVSVTNKYGRVVGGNIVGGIAGYVSGTSRIHTAYANVGVTASYRASVENLYNHDLINAYGLSSDKKVKINSLGYAGGLFGFVDITQFNTQNPSSSNSNEARVYNISTDANVTIVGKIVGGLIGGVGEYTVVYKANKTVLEGALLKGYVFAGGIVGQNNGFIKYANITYDAETQAKVDSANTGASVSEYVGLFDTQESPLAVGGIVGLNIGSTNINWPGGTIMLCSSKVAIRNSTTENAGGIVGVAYGGDIRACIASGGVYASKTAYIGGIAGRVSDFSKDERILTKMANPFGEATSCGTTIDYVVAMNNYLASDFNYYETIHNNKTIGAEGAIGGIVGYVADSSLVYTTHTVANDSSDKFGYLANPTNYFVSQITNSTSNRSETPVTSGKYINLYEESETGAIIQNYAVGKFGSESSLNLGKGKTRIYMLNPEHYDEIYSGWDKFSINNSSGTPSIEEQDLPDVIEVDSIDDLRIMYWHPEKDYILIDDIDFRDFSYTEGTRILLPFFAIGSESSPFTGSFTSQAKADGSLPRIKNVYIINSTASSLGFFGAVSNAEIKDIIIENIHFSTSLNKNSKSNVGGLAGVITDSVVDNVSILNTDPTNTGIFTNANIVGGMFGKIRTINGETIIKNCYVENNLVLGDNEYSSQTGSVEVTLGGFAGKIEGKTSLSSIMATGNMAVTYSSDTITHIVGGFAGQITGANVTESACVTSVNVTLNNVISQTLAGGFVGRIGSTPLRSVDSHANITVNLNNIGINKNMYIGGLVGEVSDTESDSSIQGFVVAGDITLNGEYTLTVSEAHYVAGILGNIAKSTSITAGYSLASIINNTMFTKTDMGFGRGSDNVITNDLGNSVMADNFYALTSNDSKKIGKDSTTVKSGSGLGTEGDIFTRDKKQQKYYYLVAKDKDNRNEFFNKLYKDIFAVGSGLYKTAPILVADTVTFDENYRYYLQTANVTVGTSLYGSTQIGTFKGVYNGARQTMTLPTQFDIGNAIETANCGLFGEIISTQEQPSMIIGVVMKNVEIYANLSDKVENFGILSGKAQQYTIFANCYVVGSLNLNIAGSTSVGGLVGSSGAKYLACAVDLVANLYGSGEFSYGSIFGKANSANNVAYTFTEVSSLGKVNDYGTSESRVVAGMVADSTESNLLGLNSYTMTEINSTSQNTANVVYSLGGNTTTGIWYDLGNSVIKTNDKETLKQYVYNAARGTNFVGGNFKLSDVNDKNYGMPMQNWIVDVLYDTTGTGTSDDPYIINTATQFVWMLQNAKQGYCYKLNCDLDYALISKATGFTITDFAGHLDGQYHYINNSTGTLFGSISGTVCRLGFKNVNVTSGTILANNVTSGSVSEIYAHASSGKVIGSGKISNSLSTGAAFGGTITNCFNLGAITIDIYNQLDHEIWISDGTNYTLKGFVTNCETLVKPVGRLTVNIDNVPTVLTTESDQDFYNAMYYASKFKDKDSIVINALNKTLDLQGHSLQVPTSVQAITGISTIKNGTFTNNSIAKFSTNSLTLENCAIVGDSDSAIFGADSSAYEHGSIVINNSLISSSHSGGLIFDTISKPINITLTKTNVLVSGEHIDLIAHETTEEAGETTDEENGVNVTISSVNLYGGELCSIIHTNNADGTISVETIGGDRVLNNMINTNSADVTITLNDLKLNGNVIVSNSGTAKIDSEIKSDVPDVGENSSRCEIKLGEGEEFSKMIATTNASGGEIIISGSDAKISSKIVSENATGGKITIDLQNSTISSPIVDTNAGDISITLKGTCTVNSTLIPSNSGKVTFTTNGANILGNGAFVGENSGEITANLTNTTLGIKIATTNTQNGTINYMQNGGETRACVVDSNAGTLNVMLQNATVGSTFVTNNTGTINWNTISGTTINAYLVETQNSQETMTITINSGNTLKSTLIKTADSYIKFVIDTDVSTQLVETNNAELTIEATGNKLSNLVGTNANKVTVNASGSEISDIVGANSSGATIEFTATGSTIKEILASNSGKITAKITNGSVTKLATTNDTTGDISATISGAEVTGCVDKNSGTLNVEFTDTSSILNALINENSGTATINIAETVTVGEDLNLITTTTDTGTSTITGYPKTPTEPDSESGESGESDGSGA